MSLVDRAVARLDALCPEEDLPDALGVALSGGGDSIALLHFCVDWGRRHRVPVLAVTVDHGLRPEAADEAAFAASVCASLGVAHTVLHWSGWSGQGNLQDAARHARRDLIADWAMAEGVEAIALGHTRDDQAETVLMNLARGSGVDGLCAMAEAHEQDDIQWIRPLLTLGRAELRAHLGALGQTWIDDPSNEDERFTRVRARKLLTTLEDLGLTADRLVDTASRMQDAREVLTLRAYDLGAEVSWQHGDLVVPLRAFRAAPRDTRHRALAAMLQAISGADQRPRFKPLSELARSLVFSGQGGTLHGVRLSVETAKEPDPDTDLLARVQAAVDPVLAAGPGRGKGDAAPIIRLTREYAAVAEMAVRPGETWDGRWCLDAKDPRLTVRALGAAAKGPLPEGRPATLPRTSLQATPALWEGDRLVAAPLAGLPGPVELSVRCRHLQARRDPLASLRGT